jgi:hypothetical protein
VELTTAGQPVALTSHPLQRIGAYALGQLGDVADPSQITQAVFEVATEKMSRDVAAAAEDVQGLGSFWLAVSYMMWPNSPVNPTARSKQSVQERRDRISAWRTYPADDLAVPCALCGRPGCGFYGKVDVPLGASVSYRNTTAPGHEGLPLCRACLASFHALPYGCALGGGRAAALHSWDDDFLRSSVRAQVRRTRQQAFVGSLAGRARIPYAREVAVLRGLGGYERAVREGVDLYLFSNSNREQVLDVQSLSQPLAEWLRKAIRDPRQRDGLRYLVRAHWTAKIPGTSLLARNAFRDPVRIVSRSRAYLSGLAAEQGAPPLETAALARLCTSFATEVLGMEERDMRQIQELGGRIAVLLARHPERGTVKKYEHVHRNSRQLQAWLRRNGVSWLLESGQKEPLITAEQWRLLFEPDAQAWFCQDLLLIAVLEALAADGRFAGTADEPGTRADREDDELFTDEEAAQ